VTVCAKTAALSQRFLPVVRAALRHRNRYLATVRNNLRPMHMETTQFRSVSPQQGRTWSLGDVLRLRVPVVQAPLGVCDGPRLSAAVSRAGALGCMTVHATPEDQLRRRLAKIRAITPRPVLLAFTAQWQRDSLLEIAIRAGFCHFQVFWWNGPRLAPLIRQAGGTVFWQVGTVLQARDALEVGADVLVAQGTDAGGPVRSPMPLPELIPALNDETAGKLPIIAGGGLADAKDVANVLALGASAALLGTRFLLSEEAQSAPCFKQRLARATADDLQLDPQIRGEWPCAPRRRLCTAFNDDVPDLFAGRGLSRIRNVLPAAEIVRQLARGL
jgi:hypothetical protein